MDGPAGAAHAVERHVEALRPDRRDVDHRQREDLGEVPLRSPPGPPAPRRAPPTRCAAGPPPPAPAPRAPASPSRKIPSGPTNLSAFHSIGLWLAVRISPAPAWWCSTASCTVGVGTMPDVDHLHAHRHEARRRGAGEHRPAGPGVPPQHHHRLAVGARPGAERRGVPGHELGGEVLSDDPAHPGDADHQGVGHAGKASGGGGRTAGRQTGGADRYEQVRREGSGWPEGACRATGLARDRSTRPPRPPARLPPDQQLRPDRGTPRGTPLTTSGRNGCRRSGSSSSMRADRGGSEVR